MPSETVEILRKQLRDKFPAAHRREVVVSSSPETTGSALPTNPSRPFSLATDRFPTGSITEISPAHPACGLSLLLAALLAESHDDSALCSAVSPLVLIDARDHFDPASFTPEECSRLLWLRCRETPDAFRSADLLLRDGNLPFVLLDLSTLPTRELRRIPTSSWHRLRQLAEASECTLLALTPTPLIPRAALRLGLTRDFTLHQLDQSRSELLDTLQLQDHGRHVRSA